jgi:nucleoside-diphosphate-sugar epimerase
MKILVLGGTGFIGPHVIRHLQAGGHRVAAIHRGPRATSLPPEVEHIVGDARHIAHYRTEIQSFAPDVLIDLILSSGNQAEALMQNVRGVVSRVVAISSMDVYRAFAVTHGMDPGPLEPLPLTEESRLRTKLHPYSPQILKAMQGVFQWLDDEYDKIPVENAVMRDEQVLGTVLRLPMVYGPGDALHRFYPIVKRIADGRQRILFSEEMAAWRSPRGYVENVAAAIALAAVSERAAGRIYNVAEQPAFSELEWAKKIADQMNWQGEFVVLPAERTPKHLILPGNTAQHWVASSERLRRELGYREPVTLEQALRRTIAWERVYPPATSMFYQFDYSAEDAATAA